MSSCKRRVVILVVNNHLPQTEYFTCPQVKEEIVCSSPGTRCLKTSLLCCTLPWHKISTTSHFCIHNLLYLVWEHCSSICKLFLNSIFHQLTFHSWNQVNFGNFVFLYLHYHCQHPIFIYVLVENTYLSYKNDCRLPEK